MSENMNTQPLDGFERVLSQFTPAPPSIDRDRLMFVAGQASAQSSTEYSVLSTQYSGRHWQWPASTAVFAATSIALAIALALRPSPSPMIVVRNRSQSAPQLSPARQLVSLPESQRGFVAQQDDRSHSPATNTYLKTRDVAVRMGLDALGSPAYSAEPSEASTYRDLWFGFISATSSPDLATDQTEKQTRM